MTYPDDDYVDSTGRYDTGYNFKYLDCVLAAHKAEASADAALAYARAEVKRIDDLRSADQTAVAAALAAQKEAVSIAQVASDKAISKAEVAQSKVNEGQNEFRATLKDQAATLMPRAETELVVRELRGLIAVLSTEINGLRSRVDIGPPTLTTLQTRSDEAAGRNAGNLDARALIFSVVGALIAIAVLVLGIATFVSK